MKHFIQKIYILALAFVLLTGCDSVQGPHAVTPEGEVITLEIARTPEERAQGLMFRTELGKDAGMLFVFDQPQTMSFWMKNTLIPLDVIFLKEDGTIVSIQTMEPCPAETELCPGYPSGGEALYALEINAGRAAELGLEAGEKLEIVIP